MIKQRLTPTALRAPWWQLPLIALSAIIVGGTGLLFWVASDFAHKILHLWVQFNPFLPLLLTPLGFVLISAITNKFFMSALGSGVPQTMAALDYCQPNHRKKLLSIPIAIAKLSLTVLGQMCGASIGQEGPMVHIGASIMYSLGKIIPAHKLSRHQLDHGLIVGGAAAGVAAAFNAPLTGIVFALERLTKTFEMSSIAALLTIVAVTTAICAPILDGHRYFGDTSAALAYGSGWMAVPVCGVVGGIFGGLFSYCFSPLSTPAFILRLRLLGPLRFSAFCGFCVAVLGLLSGSTIYGNGAQEIEQLLQNPQNLPWHYSLIKFLATFISCFSGIPGGLFAPSLAIGAGIGANISAFMPATPAAAIILLGVTAYFSAVFQAPFTAFVIVAEITGNYAMLPPLIITAFIGTGVSRLIGARPIYEAFVERWREPNATKLEADHSMFKKMGRK
ncbi:MAG: chloride channel protein [Pseudomonadota bacterium]